MKKENKKTWKTPLLLNLSNDNTNSGDVIASNESDHIGGTCALAS